MESTILRKESRTAEIVNYLEAEIISGRIAPLSKLRGTRDLAEQFSVSQPLVLQALGELEKRRLIYRKERRGVFVSATASNSEAREVLYLLFDCSPKTTYVKEITDLAFSVDTTEKINFLVRTIYTHSTSPTYRNRVLKDEIARLAARHYDAVVVVGMRFRHTEIKEVLKLPFPVLFAGDFDEGDYPDLSYNRLGFARNYYDVALDHAREIGGKKIALIYRYGNTLPLCQQKAMADFQTKAEKENIQYRLFTMNTPTFSSPEAINEAMRSTIAELEQSGFEPNTIFMQWLLKPNQWVDAIRASKVPLIAGKHEIIVDGAIMPIRDPAVRYAVVSDDERLKINRYQLEVIKQLTDKKLKNFIENYEYKTTLI